MSRHLAISRIACCVIAFTALASCRQRIIRGELVTLGDLAAFENQNAALRAPSIGGGGGPMDGGPMDDSDAPAPATPLKEATLEELLAELDQRTKSTGSPPPEHSELQEKVLESFSLSAATDTGDERDTARALLRADDSIESRLLAAVLLGRSGMLDDRNALLVEAYHELNQELDRRFEFVGPPPRTPPAPISDDSPLDVEVLSTGFSLDRVSFASEIRGLGDFNERSSRDFEAGDVVLIYGEFSGFEEIRRSTPTSPLTFRRDISASAELIGAADKVMIEQIILDEPLESDDPMDRINFWAKLELPKDTAGDHVIRIRASDRGKRENAVVDLPLTILPGRMQR